MSLSARSKISMDSARTWLEPTFIHVEKRSVRAQLVLDIGGVLATNLSPLLWEKLAAESGISETALYTSYKQDHSRRLWLGEMTEEQFWEWVQEYIPAWTTKLGRELIEQCLRPLPSLEYLASWHQVADLHILSNHLPIWVEPILAAYREMWSHIIISSEIGIRKPDLAIFHYTAGLLPDDAPVLFVDDQQRNLNQAAKVGWATLLADGDGKWADRVLPMLQREMSDSHNTM